MKPTDALIRAFEACGGQTGLARRLGLPAQNVHNWKRRGVPAEWAVKIEVALDGEVTAAQLRPDIFEAARKRTAA